MTNFDPCRKPGKLTPVAGGSSVSTLNGTRGAELTREKNVPKARVAGERMESKGVCIFCTNKENFKRAPNFGCVVY